MPATRAALEKVLISLQSQQSSGIRKAPGILGFNLGSLSYPFPVSDITDTQPGTPIGRIGKSSVKSSIPVYRKSL